MHIKKSLLRYLLIVFSFAYACTIAYWNVQLGSNNIVRLSFFGFVIFFGMRYLFKKFLRKSINKSDLLLLIYLLFVCMNYIVFSLGNSINNTLYPYFFIPFIFLFGKFIATDRSKLFFMIKIIIIFCTVIAIFAIYEYVTKTYILQTHIFKEAQIVFRSYVFADSCLSLGCLFAISTIIILACVKKKKWRNALFLINFFALLTTGSRGPLVCCVIAILIYEYLHLKCVSSKIATLLLVCAIIIIVLTITAIVANDFFYTNIKNPMINRILSVFDWTSDIGNVSRLNKWGLYLNVWLEKPFFGHGVGYASNSTLGVAESGVIQRLVEIGLIGSIMYYLPIVKVLTTSMNIVKHSSFDPKTKNMQISLICVIIAIMIEDFILQIFTSTIVGIFFWMIMAFISCFPFWIGDNCATSNI